MLIIDEVYECSLNIDFLFGYLKEILLRWLDLKLIVMFVMIDVDCFVCYFGIDVCLVFVIEVSGWLYLVEMCYCLVVEDCLVVKNVEGMGGCDCVKIVCEVECDLMDVIVDVVDELCCEGFGDVLVFLFGECEICEVVEVLCKYYLLYIEILLLFVWFLVVD